MLMMKIYCHAARHATPYYLSLRRSLLLRRYADTPPAAATMLSGCALWRDAPHMMHAHYAVQATAPAERTVLPPPATTAARLTTTAAFASTLPSRRLQTSHASPV